ncbi:MAG: ester cyclase [Solirubrobacterales bacterium]
MATTDDMRQTATRWVAEVINAGRLDAAEELCTPEAAERTRAWVGPFLSAFPDVRMDTVELVAEGDTVVGRFECSATHAGEWRGRAATGRRFEAVDEVYFFHFDGDRIVDYWGIEDTLSRLDQLGLPPD